MNFESSSELRSYIYLDHAATTPVREGVAEAMLPWLSSRFGNPSGSHRIAAAAKLALEDARDQVAALLGVVASQVFFTSGGTEADNLAVMGAPPGEVICSAIEHEAVLAAVHQRNGKEVLVDANGQLDLDDLSAQCESAVAGTGLSLVSVMLANNEVGVIQPMRSVARRVRKVAPDALIHSDLVQAVGWLDTAAVCEEVDLMSISAHKFGGPQGIGALAVRDRRRLSPLLVGGGQERGLRSGTPSVAGAVGMGEAARQLLASRAPTVERVRELRDRFVDSLVSALPGVRETIPRDTRVVSNAHLIVDGVDSQSLMFKLDQNGLGASAASSCASGAIGASHVLNALGVDLSAQNCAAVRFSLGYSTTSEELAQAVTLFAGCVSELRAATPLKLGRL